MYSVLKYFIYFGVGTGVSQKYDTHLILDFLNFFFLPAVNNDWAGTTSVAFVHLSEKQEQGTAEKERRTKNGKKQS